MDVALRELDHALSTPDCQDLAGKDTSAQATVSSTVSGGLETFAFSFDPTSSPAAWRPSAGRRSARRARLRRRPGTCMPDAANPDPAAREPG